ncbi:TIGR03364 family FAD-dependent oxidoreductase [Labrys wisconsinensis]|uniref:FAD dependent oxidoreductase TIGR03364 n=1 Tax=Labrys wisconsinensis TaxID=425677 RepID=A0ABU0J9E4_9HYPH|nr:TIGR03364 family FAD-dependent oxidoreductase [Labrys wisconsinensis]MDQ0470888.1 FAD dependent oxidoreductase TIGR03364 [Labrys wisconsinensis]
MSRPYDLAVVGAGIVGLAHALAAVRRGLSVVVIDREAQANGASIRNFGFVTVTGQKRGETWRRAMRSRDVWVEVAAAAGIPVEHAGLAVLGRRPETLPVLEAFMATEMGEGCELLTAAQARARFPQLQPAALTAALWSPHDRRVESREAIPRLAAWLAEAHGVTFLRCTAVKAVEPPRIETTAGLVEAGAAVVCPGDDLLSLFPERIAAYGVRRCKLHMLRIAPPAPGWRLPGAVMTDLSLVRYEGYAELPEAAPLKARLQAEQAPHLANGVHLIAVQSADGSLVVGDSHHYAMTPDPFAPQAVDDLILDEYRATVAPGPPAVLERWTGVYSSADRVMFRDAPADAVRLVMVTSGTGASTAFAIGEETLADLHG